MPCSYEVFADLDVVKIVFTGSTTVREVVDLLDRMDIDPAYHRTIDEILHFDLIEGNALDPAILKNVSELIRGVMLMNNRSKRMALVARRQPGRTVAEAFFDVIARVPELSVRLFDDPLAALDFLGRSDRRLLLPETRPENRHQACPS